MSQIRFLYRKRNMYRGNKLIHTGHTHKFVYKAIRTKNLLHIIWIKQISPLMSYTGKYTLLDNSKNAMYSTENLFPFTCTKTNILNARSFHLSPNVKGMGSNKFNISKYIPFTLLTVENKLSNIILYVKVKVQCTGQFRHLTFTGVKAS